jgi:hypothetical protein
MAEGFFARLRRVLFDFSAGEEENRQFLHVVEAALAESRTDAEFEKNVKRRLQTALGENPDARWDRFRQSLVEQFKLTERVTLRDLAQRFVEEFPVRVGLVKTERGQEGARGTVGEALKPGPTPDLFSKEQEGVWPPPPKRPPVPEPPGESA